jgi:hypothetical protein
MIQLSPNDSAKKDSPPPSPTPKIIQANLKECMVMSTHKNVLVRVLIRWKVPVRYLLDPLAYRTKS